MASLLSNKVKLMLTIASGLLTSTPPLAELSFGTSGRAPKAPKAKPKQGASNPLRGYYARYSHVLTEYVTEQNARKQAQGKTKFKGFRKVRMVIPLTAPGVPRVGMTVWVPNPL